ncbi:MAG TPA: ABC transporter ATP-binding protein [Gemmatimonadaceae bacterium]|nr:ABC transporter ATP-binding protein [Gemmatimonadaceae bacterium]
MLEAIHLSKTYRNGVRALSDLSLRVPDGELYCLLGANGAGKTTTLSCFLDFTVPTSGQAVVDGIVVAERPLEAKRRCGYVAERVAVYETLSAVENLRYFARLGGVRLTRAAAARALADAGLDEFQQSRPVRQYSKGMRQKLAIAIAISRGADNLLLDEPTAGLDPTAARELMTLLERVRADGCAILMSTHDVFRAARHADRIGIMRSGALVREFAPRHLTRHEIGAVYADCGGAAVPA